MGAKAVVAELENKSKYRWRFVIKNRLVTLSLDWNFLQGILIENTAYAETSYVWVVFVPWFDIYGSYMTFGHRLRGGGAFEGEPTKIADDICKTLDADLSLRELLFEPMTLARFVDLNPTMLKSPENFHPGQIFDLSVLLALDGQKETALSLLKAILSGQNPITYRERETEITRSVMNCLENDQPLQPLLDPLIAANKARWPIRPVKPRRPGAAKPKPKKPVKPIDPNAPRFAFVLRPPKP
jgi:hypothetical protein